MWKLCEYVKDQGTCSLDEVYAVFISNERKMVRLMYYMSISIYYNYDTVLYSFYIYVKFADTHLETKIQSR